MVNATGICYWDGTLSDVEYHIIRENLKLLSKIIIVTSTQESYVKDNVDGNITVLGSSWLDKFIKNKVDVDTGKLTPQSKSDFLCYNAFEFASTYDETFDYTPVVYFDLDLLLTNEVLLKWYCSIDGIFTLAFDQAIRPYTTPYLNSGISISNHPKDTSKCMITLLNRDFELECSKDDLSYTSTGPHITNKGYIRELARDNQIPLMYLSTLLPFNFPKEFDGMHVMKLDPAHIGVHLINHDLKEFGFKASYPTLKGIGKVSIKIDPIE